MAVSALWIIAAALFGAILGSFLNVVVFRLPRGYSISQPRWSFCPHCQARIPFHDNVPIFGWLILRGKCRNCSKPIGIVYPILEAVTAIVFLSLADALFVGKVIPLVGDLSRDWPIALGYFTLFAALLATSAMDIEAYSVDIRVLTFSMAVGVVAMAVWFAVSDPAGRAAAAAPVGSSATGSPFLYGSQSQVHVSATPTGLLPPSMALVGSVMGIVWWMWLVLSPLVRGRQSATDATGPLDEEPLPESPSYLQTAGQRFKPVPLLALVVLIAGMVAWMIAAPEAGGGLRVTAAMMRGLITLAVLMLLLLLASIVHRESDSQIIDEIEAERTTARRVAMAEARSLLLPFLAGLALFLFLRATGRLDHAWTGLLGILPAGPVMQGAAGFLTGLGALVWSAAIGWFVRIAGTLGFGKEAYGTGDIYIMAAIGAVMGVWGLLFTFFLAAVLAILGVVATSFWKSSRAVPFGPWLALGAFASLWLYAPLLGFFAPAGAMFWSLVTGQLDMP